MAIASEVTTSRGEIAKLGDALLATRIEPLLGPQDKGKFVAISVDSGEYEVDESDQNAMRRLLAREPQARMWLARVGYKAAYRMRPH